MAIQEQAYLLGTIWGIANFWIEVHYGRVQESSLSIPTVQQCCSGSSLKSIKSLFKQMQAQGLSPYYVELIGERLNKICDAALNQPLDNESRTSFVNGVNDGYKDANTRGIDNFLKSIYGGNHPLS